ncbi:hypothetical protein [Streptomyces sp. MNP-20]|uniref:hypothetical protein n=1 Tax=Streptomyces sp. MNP-20 TaxID=2721165 RepID=UPI00155397B6|nr:hypothetical protein [Streptomyces sp. MNP-20]
MHTPIRTWWVIFHEPSPTQMETVAVEPPPSDADAHDQRCAELEQAGHRAYVINASDEDAASDIAARIWAQELVTNPHRRAAANAHLDRTRPTR